jgi:hypothetical protein
MPDGEHLPMPWDNADGNFSVQNNNIGIIIALWWCQPARMPLYPTFPQLDRLEILVYSDDGLVH